MRTWHFEHTEKKDKRAMTAPRRSRQSRTSRFPYHPDSGGSDSNEEIIHTNKLPSSNIALSASLPSELGGMTKFLANKHKITSRSVSSFVPFLFLLHFYLAKNSMRFFLVKIVLSHFQAIEYLF